MAPQEIATKPRTWPGAKLLLCLALVTIVVGGTPASALPRGAKVGADIRLALTIDDLPAVVTADSGLSKAQVLDRIAEALTKHRVPTPVGFFNGSNMDDDPATRAALRRWLSRGFVLGNHTFSHERVSEQNGAAFARDIERNHALITDLGQPDTLTGKYFRYPFLERGTARDERIVRSYLARHGYRVADVSVDFQDWGFSAAFTRCRGLGDARAAAALVESYLTYARAELLWAVDTAQRVLGRPIPHVLMVHANEMTAQMLDALLSEYERLGVRFVALGDALDDPVYSSAQTPDHGDSTLLPALMRERRAHIEGHVPLPSSLLDALCR